MSAAGFGGRTVVTRMPRSKRSALTTMMIGIGIVLRQVGTTNSYKLSDRPVLKYGTAWKKEATSDLVQQAIKSGFRHIDTACQPRHYNEGGVGEGWTAAAKDLNLKREDIWLQTKYSSIPAQDPDNIPYDKDAPLEERVRQSLHKSLENLRTDYIDSWVMHGPEGNWDDHWKVCEECAPHLCWQVFAY